VKDRTLLDIFLTQASSALAVMQDPKSSKKARAREIADLAGAAELLGNDEIQARVDQLIEALAQGDPSGTEKLSAIIREMRVPRPPVIRQDSQSDGIPLPRPERGGFVGDSAPTRVQPSPRRRTSKFDTGEHLTLLNFFREEASEGLDRITDLLLEGSSNKPNENVLNELMRLTHGLKGAAGTVDLPTIAELSHQYEDAVERIRVGALKWSVALRDELVEVADQLRIVIADAIDPAATHAGAERLQQRLSDLDKTTDLKTGEQPSLLITEGQSAQTFPERRRPDRRSADSPMLRVDPIRIDRLMNSASELVFDRTRIEKRVAELTTEVQRLQSTLQSLTQERASWIQRATPLRADQVNAALAKVESRLSESLPRVSSAMERLQEDTSLLRRTEFALQDGLTGVRMQSVRSLFQRLTPQLRAIARQANKQVRLVTAGGDTEFDKTVADQLVDPIIQLLRNAVAHGIEAPEVRASRDKSPEGRITVTARHEGNVVVLEVGDDGGGIDTMSLRTRAVESKKWTMSRAQQASEERVMQLIFDSGYSSRSETDELAGRGVGLSAVRQTVTRLGGEVQVSSVPRRGTTFTMRLPLTTAIVDAMLFKVGGHVFALPNVHVLETGSTALPLDESIADADGHPFPLLNLHQLLHFDIPAEIESTPVVLLEYLGRRLAVSCDKIVGPREIVVKNLGPMLAGVPLYSGATISPSGKVQLILDTAALTNLAYPEQARAESTKTPSGLSKRVLVVDDSRATREAMRNMLERAGYHVLSAADGRSAWNSINEQGCDLLVTDLEMPGEDGFALLERLRADPRHQDLPALIISTKDTEANRRRALALAAVDFIPKPVTQKELIDALRAASREGES
jgi:chemosensory pili system protein ChpA (sensor histidine kinase/response regulator)